MQQQPAGDAGALGREDIEGSPPGPEPVLLALDPHADSRGKDPRVATQVQPGHIGLFAALAAHGSHERHGNQRNCASAHCGGAAPDVLDCGGDRSGCPGAFPLDDESGSRKIDDGVSFGHPWVLAGAGVGSARAQQLSEAPCHLAQGLVLLGYLHG